MIPPRNADLVVPEPLAGERLDRAVAALGRDLSRGEARRLIDGGVVFVDGRRIRVCSRPVRAGERIQIGSLAAPRTADEPQIVADTQDLWIVNKPAGMPVEPTRQGALGTVVDWLRKQVPRPAGAFITHRLDVATSGLVAVAKTAAAQAELNRLFAAHAIERRYLAVVAAAGTRSAPLALGQELRIDRPLDGRAAATRARVVARSDLAAALVVDLETGRTRQIRRHLAGEGMPVVGETVEGRRSGGRLLLHAFALQIPWHGGRLGARAEPPVDFQRSAAALGLTEISLP